MHWAARMGHVGVAKMLLQSGARFDAKAKGTAAPMIDANERGARLLRDHPHVAHACAYL